jgi:spore cortex formation protein SpoVR/YcgB (stage V sporulation)
LLEQDCSRVFVFNESAERTMARPTEPREFFQAVEYPNQIEIITAEQMRDAYSSVGMPLYYRHWSFGKHFASREAFYRKGLMGLAYEIVVNSSPCISYLMEENTSTMQALVIAHAAFKHNHFFKSNVSAKLRPFRPCSSTA